MAVTLKQFMENLQASGLMTAAQLRNFRASLPKELSHLTAESLARELVRHGKLSNYQVTQVYEGNTQNLVLGENYVIVEQIGSGGMGDVFRAEHRRMKRPVVVKILRLKEKGAEGALKRFEREIQAAAKLSHPNIVTAFDAGQSGDAHFLVMELVEGRDLGSVIKTDGPLDIELAVDYMLQAATGLDYAHARGIIHRDIKPSNLLVDSAGVVKVLDLGLARLVQESQGGMQQEPGEDTVTEDNQIVGTVDYMSPEQADRSAEIDERADVYSLGCTLYRLITGRPPYPADSLINKLVAHRVEPIPVIQEHRPEAPESLQRVFRAMVAKSPVDRPANMSQVIGALERCRLELRSRPGTPTTTSCYSPSSPRIASGVASQADVTRSVDPTEDTDQSSLLQIRGKRKELAVGIDLGTSYSVVSYIDTAGRLQTLTNAEGDKTTPSVVLFDGDEVVIGKEAIKAMATDMELVAECVKRELGHRSFHKTISGSAYPPEALQGWILNKLRVDAWASIGRFEKVVITVPAYFDEVRRKATQDAGFMAGFDVLDIINEPTAAAIAFGYQQGLVGTHVSPDSCQRILVYDLGGGTFDATVMELKGNQFTTLATDGDVRLGGRDWDQRLVDYVATELIRQTGIDPREAPNSFGRLLYACEEAKGGALSARHRTNLVIDVQGAPRRVSVTREEFEEMTQDLLERTAFTAQKTIHSASLKWEDIDRVLLVGGSTRMPAVAARLKHLTGRDPDYSVSPDEAVAHGAALHAAILLDEQEGGHPSIVVRNVNSHSLGVAAFDRETQRKQTAVVIPRNTGLPVTAKRVFRTRRNNQKSILVRIVEGESDSPNDCVQIGSCTVCELPPGLPAQTPVEVRFRYHQNGRLAVQVRVAGTNTDLSYEIYRENSLSREEVRRWREKISGLPFEEDFEDNSESTFTATPDSLKP